LVPILQTFKHQNDVKLYNVIFHIQLKLYSMKKWSWYIQIFCVSHISITFLNVLSYPFIICIPIQLYPLPSVVALQKRQWKRRPPSTNCMNGHIYALHLLHLTGPISPMFTMGGKYSSSNIRAKGLTTRPNGTAT
jgi:hypothetical protein